jgi:hypothetical protein
VKTQLYVPDRLKVGFNKREDTYTGQLAYVIFFDHSGKLQKEKSWEGWRDKTIEPVEYDNKPRHGFVLNRQVGGAKQSWGHNVRIEKVRVYDPRGFEIEITVPNLLFLLQESDCSRGKGLEAECVYAWNKQSLILLPVASKEYKECVSFTKLQAQRVHVKDLIPGATYLTYQEVSLIYIGRFDYYQGLWRNRNGSTSGPFKQKLFVFYNAKAESEYQRWLYLKNVKKLATLETAVVASNYAELVDEYNKSVHGSPPKRLFLKPTADPKNQNWFVERPDGRFLRCGSRGTHIQPTIITHEEAYGHLWLNVHSGALMKDTYSAVAIKPGGRAGYDHWSLGHRDMMEWIEPTGQTLWVELASGAQFDVNYYPFRSHY